MTVTLEDIEAAAAAIDGAVIRTPMARSHTLSAITGAEVFLKFENQQFTASFKDRGALNKLLSLSEPERAGGVMAASAGNHAQGVAYHAERMGIPATIVMPINTPNTKVQHTKGFGARVVLHGDTLADSAPFAEDMADKEGLTLIHPFNDPIIIAGQGTVALEMLADVPTLDVLMAPVGGGGLIAGCAVAAKSIKPDIKVIGVEADHYPSLHQILNNLPKKSGGPTIAEGIAVKEVGAVPLGIIRAFMDDVLVVEETAIEQAICALVEIEKTVAEGAGAVTLAALMANPDRFAGQKVGLVISGGNIDSRLLAQVLNRGLVRTGRIFSLRVDITDEPGTLARVSTIIGENGGNIIEVRHQRLFLDVPAKAAELDLMIETRDQNSGKGMVTKLTEAGFTVHILSAAAENR
ncbi:MAG: threonine ammonia-lyase [Alphaproteobacteria bacterium]|nr:threonine ammonia-lyase [Alphaproteobacteria bacterium]